MLKLKRTQHIMIGSLLPINPPAGMDYEYLKFHRDQIGQVYAFDIRDDELTCWRQMVSEFMAGDDSGVKDFKEQCPTWWERILLYLK